MSTEDDKRRTGFPVRLLNIHMWRVREWWPDAAVAADKTIDDLREACDDIFSTVVDRGQEAGRAMDNIETCAYRIVEFYEINEIESVVKSMHADTKNLHSWLERVKPGNTEAEANLRRCHQNYERSTYSTGAYLAVCYQTARHVLNAVEEFWRGIAIRDSGVVARALDAIECVDWPSCGA
jgi:hypothetical protein